jgi:hypothetical protein
MHNLSWAKCGKSENSGHYCQNANQRFATMTNHSSIKIVDFPIGRALKATIAGFQIISPFAE